MNKIPKCKRKNIILLQNLKLTKKCNIDKNSLIFPVSKEKLSINLIKKINKEKSNSFLGSTKHSTIATISSKNASFISTKNVIYIYITNLIY